MIYEETTLNIQENSFLVLFIIPAKAFSRDILYTSTLIKSLILGGTCEISAVSLVVLLNIEIFLSEVTFTFNSTTRKCHLQKEKQFKILVL